MVDLSYGQSVEPTGPPGRAFPRLPEEMPAGAFGGEVGRGLENAGSVAEQHFNKVTELARQTQLTDFHNQAQQIAHQLSYDPKSGFMGLEGKNAFGQSDGYLSKFDQSVEPLLAGIPDERARLAARQAAHQIRGQLQEQFNSHELGQFKEYGVNTAKTSVALAGQAAVANYNHPDIIATNLDHIDASLESLGKQQGWSDEQLAEAKYAAHAQTHGGVLDAMLADNKVDMARAYYDHYKGELKGPEQKALEQAINAGAVKSEADRILGAYGVDTPAGARALSSLSLTDPEQRAAVMQKVEAGRRDLAIQKQQDPDIRRQFTQITDAIALGKADGGTLSQVERLWRQGALTDEQRLVYRDNVQRSLKKQDGTQLFLDQAKEAYDNRTPLDPKDKDAKLASNALMGVVARGQPPGSNAFNTAAIEITSRIGVVPESVVSFGRANLLGGDPRAAAAAANLFAQLHETNPYAYGLATDEKTRAVADTIARAVKAGADPEKSVELARDNAQLSTTERAELDKQWNRRYPATQAPAMDAKALSHALSSDPLYEGPGKLSVAGHEFLRPGVPAVSPALTAEFDSLTHEYFLHTGGNLQQSQALAVNDLKGTWGVSSVNGGRQLMKYAPERMVPGLTADMVREDLKESGHGDAQLTESAETGRSGGKVWNLSQKDQFGAWDVVRDARGRPLRYQLPALKAAAEAAQAAQTANDKSALTHQLDQQNRAEEATRESASMFRGVR